MPRGFSAAKKVGEFRGRSGGMVTKPKGIIYFSLKDQQTAKVRFVQMIEDVDWARKWRLPPNRDFPYGELVNAVDQHEDGTPDPGYSLNLKTGFQAYPCMIWRGAPVFQRDAAGALVKDSNGNKVLTGYADQVAMWECSWQTYATLREIDETYRGLTSRDFQIKRIGGGTDTKYMVTPVDVDGGPQPMSQVDLQLAANGKIDTTSLVKIPTYDELNSYLTGNAAKTTVVAQVQNNNSMSEGPNPFL